MDRSVSPVGEWEIVFQNKTAHPTPLAEKCAVRLCLRSPGPGRTSGRVFNRTAAPSDRGYGFLLASDQQEVARKRPLLEITDLQPRRCSTRYLTCH